jgi:3-oxoisoapionate decarboxylase
MNAEGLIDAAAALSVAVVQLCDNIPLPEFDSAALERLAGRARDGGIALEAGVRGTDPVFLHRMIEVSGILGARLLRTMITATVEQAEADVRRVLPDLERHGVTLAIENYERHSVWDLEGLIQRLGSPRVGACLDTVNSLGALETPREAIASLLSLTASLHVKDFDIVRADHRMGYSVVGTAAGKGRLDIPGLIEGARRNGRDPNAIVELWTPLAGDVEQTIATEQEWARESISYLRRYITS